MRPKPGSADWNDPTNAQARLVAAARQSERNKARIKWLSISDTYVEPIRDVRGRWDGWWAAWRNGHAYRGATKLQAIDRAIKGGP